MRNPKRILEKILSNGQDPDQFEQTGEPLVQLVEVLRDVTRCRRTRQWITDNYNVDIVVSPEIFTRLLEIPQINFIENSNRILEVDTVSLKEIRSSDDPVTIGNLNSVLKEFYRNLESTQGRLQNEYPNPSLIGEMRGEWIDQVTEQVIQSGLIQHLAFTGSVTGGRRVKTSVGSQFIETGLELGGKDPAYIREDANLDKVIPAVMDGVFYNAGQSCCAVERIYVHHTLFDTFLSRAIQYMNALNIGNPMEETTDLGPMAQLSGVETAIAQINDAETKGADVHYYSGNVPEESHFLAPAILTNVNHQMDIMQEESFGPIVGIMPVQSDADAIKLMNDSPYGLTASVWTKDTEKAIEIGNQIETGTFYMNRCDVLDPALPWVGVKDSGKGCTLSTLGIQEMTRPKAFNMKFD